MDNQSVFWEEHGHPPEPAKGYGGGRVKGSNRGYPAPPGTGPEGEACKTCYHKTTKPGTAGRYLKCRLMYKHWTGGGATDIKSGSPACRKWVSKRLLEAMEFYEEIMGVEQFNHPFALAMGNWEEHRESNGNTA